MMGTSEISILLIEDHDLTRMGLRAALQSHSSLKVIGEAANANQGLKLLERTKPDIAVIDIGLPDMDGVELTRNFKHYQTETGQTNTKVLILTMDHTEDAILAAFAAGADSYCLKESSINKLIEAIQTTYSGNSWIDPAISNVVLRKMRQGIFDHSDGNDKLKTLKDEPQEKDEELLFLRVTVTELTSILVNLTKYSQNQNIINFIAQSQSLSIVDNSKKVEGDISMTSDRTINTSGGNYNERIEGDYVQGNKYAGQPQSLAEAAAEIQALLKQLEQTYPTSTTSEKMVVAAQAVDQIESNPLLKQRVINAIKEGSLAAFEKAIDNPIGAFVVHAIQGWQEVEID